VAGFVVSAVLPQAIKASRQRPAEGLRYEEPLLIVSGEELPSSINQCDCVALSFSVRCTTNARSGDYTAHASACSLCGATPMMKPESEEVRPPAGDEVAAFAADWYRMLDEHVPGPEISPLVIDEGLEFVVPEATLRSRAEFQKWYTGGDGYPGVINQFFDEAHTIRELETLTHGMRAAVKVVVNWQAKRWTPPAPRSEWVGFDVFQTWEIVRSAETGRPIIARYVVDELRPMPGSPPL
jgi:hypothetical protein